MLDEKELSVYMARRLFYVDSIRGGRAEIVGDTARHLRKVLRVEEGQRFEVSDNESLYLAEVSAIGKDLVEFNVVETLEPTTPAVRVHLLASLIKFDHFEWMIEKATELGVERITPVVASRSDPGLDEAAAKRMARWTRIAWESGQQSRRVRRPEIEDLRPLSEVVRDTGRIRLWLDEESSANPVLQALPIERRPTDEVHLLCGPEGGWTPAERELAHRHQWLPVSLGRQILRAETAALAALAVVGAWWNNSRVPG